MEAPFTQIGPGQVGRLVYQVIGTNGPIPNPNKIRYMAPAFGPDGLPASFVPPVPLPTAPAAASALMGAVQLANLGFSVANFVISAAILVEVKKQTRILREIQVGLDHVQSQIKTLLETVERIDLNVAEEQLRENLRYALQSAAKGQEVDLVLLSDLVGSALDKFMPSIGGNIPAGTKRDLILSPEVREMAEAALHMLWGARLTAIEAHNLSCSGAALRVVRDRDVPDDLRRVAEIAAFVALTDDLDEIPGQVGDRLKANRLFWGNSDGLLRFIGKRLSDYRDGLNRLDSVPSAVALLAELHGQDMLAQARKEGPQAVAAVLNDYLAAWAAHSDAGLLWRLRYEIDVQANSDYWSALEGWLTPLEPDSGPGSPLGVTRSLPDLVA